MSFIGPLGSQEIAVPAAQSIIVGCFGGTAKVYYGTPAAGGLFTYDLHAQVSNGVTTFGSFSAGQQVRIDAPNGFSVEYVTGTTPQLTQANPANMPTMQMGSGQSVLLSTANGLTAHAGGGQGSALALTADISRVTTVGTAADSVVLPAALPGMEKTVINAAAANSMNVFPASGEIINALSANAALAVAANKTVAFSCAVAGQWHSLLTA